MHNSIISTFASKIASTYARTHIASLVQRLESAILNAKKNIKVVAVINLVPMLSDSMQKSCYDFVNECSNLKTRQKITRKQYYTF